MAEVTKIEWCHHTWNPWMGCTKVSPACDHCYAETEWDKRYHVVKWGGPRVQTSEDTRRKPYAWNRGGQLGSAELRIGIKACGRHARCGALGLIREHAANRSGKFGVVAPLG